MAARIVATAVADYTATLTQEYLIAEVDDRDDGPNKGKTIFSAMDDAYFAVFATVPYSASANVGTLTSVGKATIRRTIEVSEYLEKGMTSKIIEISPPAAGVDYVTEIDPTPGLIVKTRYKNGAIASVELQVSDNPNGLWLVGVLELAIDADIWKVTPPPEWESTLPDLARIHLLVVEQKSD